MTLPARPGDPRGLRAAETEKEIPTDDNRIRY